VPTKAFAAAIAGIAIAEMWICASARKASTEGGVVFVDSSNLLQVFADT